MSGEVAIFGIFLPSLLVLGLAALIATMVLARLLSFAGFYRLIAYRALVDVCLFILMLGLFSRFSSLVGLS